MWKDTLLQRLSSARARVFSAFGGRMHEIRGERAQSTVTNATRFLRKLRSQSLARGGPPEIAAMLQLGHVLPIGS